MTRFYGGLEAEGLSAGWNGTHLLFISVGCHLLINKSGSAPGLYPAKKVGLATLLGLNLIYWGTF
jgi:hypothetical protein